MARFRNAIKAGEKRVRRGLRTALGQLLTSLSRRQGPSAAPMEPDAIRQVLVVRMNGRMGNTLFLTPLLTGIHDVMPHAAIDVFVSYPDAWDLLRGLPGLRRVITVPHKGWWDLRRSLATLRAYRSTRYDLAIDPQANSSGGRIALLLARARWRLGFAGAQQWLRLDFAAEVPAGVRHEALRPLALLQQAFGYEVVAGGPRLKVGNSAEELAAGARLFEERLRSSARSPGGGVRRIGFFASARGEKDLGARWWREFWQAYLARQPATLPLEVLPTPTQPPVAAEFATVHCPSPRNLAATIAHADWFFSADTGPMHLASAAGVPTIAFFEHTNPAAYGPIKPEDTVLRISGMTPQAVAEACADIVARSAAASVTSVVR